MQPTTCHGCVDAVSKERAGIIKDVEKGIVNIHIIADHVWNKIKDLFGDVTDWFKHHF